MEDFIAGRYETGGFNTNNAVIRAGEVTGSINNANWYKMYNKTKTLSKTEEEKNITKASIIWGCQYDQMIKFAECASKTTETVSSIESGAVATDCNKNIYDLCGNLYDWTMEANYTYLRVYRGGSYCNSYSASVRGVNVDYPVNSNTSYGSRATLYIVP